MKTLLTWLRYTLARARYHMAAADLDFMEAAAPRAIGDSALSEIATTLTPRSLASSVASRVSLP